MLVIPVRIAKTIKDNVGWSDWEEFHRLTPMIKQTYKSKSRKNTEKQALLAEQARTETQEPKR